MNINASVLDKVIERLQIIQSPKAGDCFLEGISPVTNPRPNTVVFFKTKPFFKKFLAQDVSSIFSNLVCILQSDLFEQLQNSDEWKTFQELGTPKILAKVDDSEMAMVKLSKVFFDKKNGNLNDLVDGRQMGTAEVNSNSDIGQGVFIGQNVKIAANVTIYPGVTIMSNCEIGEGTVIYPNVTLYRDVKIGKNVCIHSGTVIGSDGFGYIFRQGVHHKIWHIGGVVVEDNVEIGANVTIDKGTFSNTIIGAGTKIDNQVQIGHNGQLGKGVILCGQVGLSGSVKLDDYCVLGGKAAVAPDTHVGQGSQIAGMAGVTGDLGPGSQVAGHPARPVKEWLRSVATLRKLTSSKN